MERPANRYGPRRDSSNPRDFWTVSLTTSPLDQATVLLPSGPLGFWKIRPVMGSDAILSPQRRFRDTLRHLHHIFHFQGGSVFKRLSHQLSPP